eukprot:3778474-Rhodomonas_salina.1
MAGADVGDGATRMRSRGRALVLSAYARHKLCAVLTYGMELPGELDENFPVNQALTLTRVITSLIYLLLPRMFAA